MFGIYGGSYGESQIIRNIDKYELLKCHLSIYERLTIIFIDKLPESENYFWN